ncbi:uncharacterized protein DKFZp434B061-like isoform X4 [Manis pentadactyla]|uniref:uncharacterized protein DKFZp434B061-like isoform X4 n=1 Tax=Manis pentadactyla TaxID=143292 RepID=UPI00255C62C0|nr:uncharacterized protein DKFZp434B061-like isoform X4 [Manis pentadactyla]
MLPTLRSVLAAFTPLLARRARLPWRQKAPGRGRGGGHPPAASDWRAPPCASRPRPAPASQSRARLRWGRSVRPSEPARGARGSGSRSAPVAAGFARQPRRRHDRATLAGAESARLSGVSAKSSSTPRPPACWDVGPQLQISVPTPVNLALPRGFEPSKRPSRDLPQHPPRLHPRTLEGAEGLQFFALEPAWGTRPCTPEGRE